MRDVQIALRAIGKRKRDVLLIDAKLHGMDIKPTQEETDLAEPTQEQEERIKRAMIEAQARKAREREARGCRTL